MTFAQLASSPSEGTCHFTDALACMKDKIMTTRIAGGLLLGHDPKKPGQGLKSLAFASFRPYGRLARGVPARRAVPGYFLDGSSYSLALGRLTRCLPAPAHGCTSRSWPRSCRRLAGSSLPPRTSCSRTCISGWHACRTWGAGSSPSGSP